MVEQWMIKLPHGITLSCRSAGARGRPVLMFLHGFPEAAFIWDELLAHFAAPEHGGFRCVAPNLRGFERSSSPSEVAAYRPKHLVQDLAALIDAECGTGGTLAALVAHDWGGAVAWNLAAERPARLERLIVINSPHPQTFARELQTNPAQQAASAYMNFLIRPDAQALLAENDFARLWPFFDVAGASGVEAARRITEAVVGFEHAPPMQVATEGTDWMTEALRQQYRAVWQGDGSAPGAGLAGQLNYYRVTPLRPAHANDPGAMAVQMPPQAFTVTVPTLLLWAMNDAALLPSLLDGLDAWVPHLNVERIDGATHWVVHERPALVAECISRHLAT